MLDTATNAAALLPHHPTDHRGCYSIRTPRWACVYTHPQAETWANTNLRRAGYQTYLPTFAARVRDRVVPTLHHVVTRPIFPRYLFLLFDHLEASWSPIRATPGVVDLVRSGSEPAYASEAAVRALQALDAQRATPAPKSCQWAPGAVCRVGIGIFQGHPGVVTIVANDTALVSLLFLGHLREIALPLDCLEPRGDT